MAKKKKTPKKTPTKRPPTLGTSIDTDLNKKPPLSEDIVKGDLVTPVSNPDPQIQEVDTAGCVGGTAGTASGVAGTASDLPSGSAPVLRSGEIPEVMAESQNPSNDCNVTKVQQATQPASSSGHQPSIPVIGKGKSWADCVSGRHTSLQQKGERYKHPSGSTCVTIPNEVITRNKKAWTSFVIGQFHGNLPSMGTLHGILNGIWSSKNRDISISRSGDQAVLIKIPNPTTRKRVLNQGVWHIEGQTMFVGEWEPGLKPEIPELKEIPVWVDFKGVPPHFFSAEGFEYIAGMVGKPLQLHPRTAAMMNLEVARVFTLVDLKEPFPEDVYVSFESGETHRIEVSCQWLPPLCSYCQKHGHSLKRCPTAPITCKTCSSTMHEDSECPRIKRRQNNPTARRASPKPTYRRRTPPEKVDTIPASSQHGEAVVTEVPVEIAKELPEAEKEPELGTTHTSPPTLTEAPPAQQTQTSNATSIAPQNAILPTQSESAGKQPASPDKPMTSHSSETTSDSDSEEFPKLGSKQGKGKKVSVTSKKAVTQAKLSKGRGPLGKNKF